ncbi:uncharacterized protein EDB91DRAFT_1086621 [Suillus paluster]|uniref:uncharacterized protein n=1 Tax=Suillus paluster TaxID=48578 RepID=UPI001B86E22C|nr:uncharacterized protein EDB91DRAFT_1086621 [Suillus paluster]KAG1726880.1 hypothetical protein EDB91DRAFT_1086621 [Suillus paluster]
MSDKSKSEDPKLEVISKHNPEIVGKLTGLGIQALAGMFPNTKLYQHSNIIRSDRTLRLSTFRGHVALVYLGGTYITFTFAVLSHQAARKMAEARFEAHTLIARGISANTLESSGRRHKTR